MYYNVGLGDAKKLLFFIKKLFNSGTGMRFNFSSPLGMGRVAGKYMRIGYGDGEGKTRAHPALLPCLLVAGTKIQVW